MGKKFWLPLLWELPLAAPCKNHGVSQACSPCGYGPQVFLNCFVKVYCYCVVNLDKGSYKAILLLVARQTTNALQAAMVTAAAAVTSLEAQEKGDGWRISFQQER